MSNVIKFESGAVQVKKQLPSEEVFRMDYLEGWDDISEPQKAYLCTYFDTYPKKMKACVESGITQSAYRKWVNGDKQFIELMQIIEQIHREELEYLEYIESYTDSKVRGRYLKKGKSSPSVNKIEVNNYGSKNGAFSKLDEIIEEAEFEED